MMAVCTLRAAKLLAAMIVGLALAGTMQTLRAADIERRVFVRIEMNESPGELIEGEADAIGFERWIKAAAIGHGFDVLPGANSGRARAPFLGDFTIIKKVDRASPLIMKAFFERRQFSRVTVVQTASVEGQQTHAPVRVELGNVTVSDVHLSSGAFDRVFMNSQSDRPTEEVSFTYDRVRWRYTPRGPQGVEPPVEAEFDTLFGSGDPDLDSDMDGIPNSQDKDDDNDRILDRYELAFGLDPLNDDADGDLDGDGQSNRGEFAAGTAADDPRSYFSITTIEQSLTDRSSALIVFPILPQRQYQILGSSDGRTWTELAKFNVPIDSVETEAEVVVPLDRAAQMLRVSVRVPE